MSQGKSGFELRTDILGMAVGMLENNRDQEVHSFYSIPEDQRDGKPAPVIWISPEEVINTAKELYAFVNEK